MDLGELELDAIEEECRKKGQGYVSDASLNLSRKTLSERVLWRVWGSTQMPRRAVRGNHQRRNYGI